MGDTLPLNRVAIGDIRELAPLIAPGSVGVRSRMDARTMAASVVQWGQRNRAAGAALEAPPDPSHEECAPVTDAKSSHVPDSPQPKNDGRFKQGEHRSRATEFKPGQHWRPRQPFWDKAWLEREYVERQRSAGDIARQFGVGTAAIMHWLRKHDIPRRSVSDARHVKRWGARREANGMHGRSGQENPNWKGGITPERQAFYSSQEWKDVETAVRERDRGTCQRCGSTESGQRDMHVHHIAPFAVVHLRAEPSNLVLLCPRCHGFIHRRRNVGREFIKDAPDA